MHNTNKKLEVLVITLGVFFKCLIPLGQCIQVLKTPPVVLKGYDVVAYHLNAAEGNDIATLGNETYSYNLTSSDSYGIDRIYTFYFVNENNLQLFMNDAWKYVPQFGGFSAFDICFDSDHNDDIWNGIHMGPASGPDNEFHGFGIYNNTLYLNINENMYKTFEENAPNCIKLAQTQWIEWFGSLNAGIFNHDCFDDGNACMATPQALAPAVNSSQDRFLTSMSTTEIGNDNGNNNKKSDDYYVGKLTKKEFFVLLIGIAMIFALIIGICIIISQYRKYIKMYDETHDMNSNNDTSNTKDTKIGTKSTKKVKVSNESRRSFIPLASSEEANNPDVIIENMKQIGFGDLSSALEDVGNDNDNDNTNDNDNENDENKNNNDNNSDDNNNDDIVDPIKDYDDNSDDNEQNENEIENNKMSNNNNNNNNGAINTTATITTNVESFRLPPPS